MRRTATLLLAFCMTLVAAAQTAFHGREIRRRPDMGNVDMIDTVSWYANESVRLEIEPWRCGERLPIPDGATALWIVADEGGTNWIVRYASTVTATNAVFDLAAGEGALPEGHDYTGFVDLLQGTNILGVIDRFEVSCITSAYGISAITPAAGTWEGLAAAVASNTAAIAEHTATIVAIESDLDTLRGELQGPAWLTPARFEWMANVLTTVTTNIGEEVDGGWAVLTRTREVVTEREYILDPVIERNQWNSEMETTVDGPATLAAVGDGTYLLSWNADTEPGATATVSGQLGDWRDTKTVEMMQVGNVLTQQWFSCFAPGGVREQLANVLTAWTNMGGNIYRFMNYPSTRTSTVETLSLTPNPDFWARNCDLSGVTAWNNDWYYTKPATLIASNLCYGAAHWSVPIGTTLAWYGKDGRIHASQVVDQRRMTGDLCVSKLSPPLDTNAVTAYPILDLSGIDWKIRAGDGAVNGLPPMPVLAMAAYQHGWIMRGDMGTGAYGIWDDDALAYIRNSRNCAVSGDSGHPVFVSTDATNLVLIGCYWKPNGLSVPGGEMNKSLVRSAVEAMGGDPDAIRWESWTNWPTYLGPLNNPP